MKTAIQTLCLCLVAGSLHAAKTASTPLRPSAPSRPATPLPVTPSVYQPKNLRDPFLRVGQEMSRATSKTSSTATTTAVERAVPASAFRLQAIINVPPNPVAQINDQELILNKLTAIETRDGTVQVKMLQIHSDHIIIEVAGQQIELKLEELDSTQSSKEKGASGLIPAKIQKQQK